MVILNLVYILIWTWSDWGKHENTTKDEGYGPVPTECVTAVLTSSVWWSRRRRRLTVGRTHHVGLTGVEHAGSALRAAASGPRAGLPHDLHQLRGILRCGPRAWPPHGRSEDPHVRGEVECVHVSKFVPQLRETPYLRVRQKHFLRCYDLKRFQLDMCEICDEMKAVMDRVHSASWG